MYTTIGANSANFSHVTTVVHGNVVCCTTNYWKNGTCDRRSRLLFSACSLLKALQLKPTLPPQGAQLPPSTPPSPASLGQAAGGPVLPLRQPSGKGTSERKLAFFERFHQLGILRYNVLNPGTYCKHISRMAHLRRRKCTLAQGWMKILNGKKNGLRYSINSVN